MFLCRNDWPPSGAWWMDRFRFRERNRSKEWGTFPLTSWCAWHWLRASAVPNSYPRPHKSSSVQKELQRLPCILLFIVLYYPCSMITWVIHYYRWYKWFIHLQLTNETRVFHSSIVYLDHLWRWEVFLTLSWAKDYYKHYNTSECQFQNCVIITITSDIAQLLF